MKSLGYGAALWCGLAAFVVSTVALWPRALSFGDEIAYLGQARLFLEGQIALRPDSPVPFDIGPGGQPISRYPLFVPLVLTPLVALKPALVFAVGLASLVAAVLVAAAVLRRWGSEPALALLLLVHPTFVLVSRTTMPDVWLAAAALAAWWFDQQGRRWLCGMMFALVMLLKPTGAVIAAGLVVGAAVQARIGGAAPATVLRRMVPAVLGSAVGGIGVAALNWLSWRHFGYPYDVTLTLLPVPVFALRYLKESGLAHLLSIVLIPPGLVLGAWGLWRRRQIGPLLVVVGLLGMMSVYFFFDFGRSRLETLVLTQRLVLPASAFLVVGLGDLLSPLVVRLRLRAVAGGALALAAPAVALAIGWQQRAWQKPMREALAAADAIAAERGVVRLGTTYSAAKAALLHDGPVSLVHAGKDTNPPVALCSVVSASYRHSQKMTCDLPGYDARSAFGPMRVLVARQASAPERSP